MTIALYRRARSGCGDFLPPEMPRVSDSSFSVHDVASPVSLIFNIVFPPPKAMINCVLQIFCIFLIYPLVKRPIF